MVMAKVSLLPSGDASDSSHIPSSPPDAMCQEESSNSRGWINQRTWTRDPCPDKQLEAKSSLQRQQSDLEDGGAGRDQGPIATEREVQGHAPGQSPAVDCGHRERHQDEQVSFAPDWHLGVGNEEVNSEQVDVSA